ncbi:MAG: PAS domain S-box protein, partial [Daejeonella sp.]|nr:PAS domain S-box protein [Daejeonella sp.]
MPVPKDNRPYSFLIIEDNPGDYLLIEDYIMEYITAPLITHAVSFVEAKSLFKEKDFKRFDLILLDLSLPDKGGSDLIQEMLQICPGSPIIVLTGFADFDFSVKSLAMGISDYLLKDDLNSFFLYKSIIYSIERNKSLLELEESEKKYSDLFHLSPQPMWVYEVETLKFLDVNEAAIKQYGYSFEEFLSMTIEQIRPEEDIPLLKAVLQQSKISINQLFENRFRHKRKSGEVIYVEIQSSLILFKGRVAKIILAQNVTDQIKYVSAIEDQNRKLSEISWIQSHVVRAPIARLMGLIDLIKNPDISEEQKLEMLDYILQSAYELDDIVRDITKKSEAYNIEFK